MAGPQEIAVTPHRLDWVPQDEWFVPGHTACPGCGAALAMRHMLKILGPDTVVVIPACCWAIIAGAFPYTSLIVPGLNTAFACSAAVASGIKAALRRRRKNAHVLVWAGDGGTYDIGIQALSGAIDRNEDIIYVCYDNEGYMNTGIQRSGSTPYGAWTTTTPTEHPKDRPKKDFVDLIAAHKPPYVATLNLGYLEDFYAKVNRAKTISGTRFLHLIAPCPPGWKSASKDTVRLARLVADTGLMPLFEVEKGTRYKYTVKPKGTRIREYIKLQGRFSHFTEEDIQFFQNMVDAELARVTARVEHPLE
ncbi:MAG TPA: pyruvate synthase subunit beta [Planctomycetes bacterium]|nr:pyruvate synthase subunit beta [Planctomycetota bacterium]